MNLCQLPLILAALVLGCSTNASGEELPRWGEAITKRDADWYSSTQAIAVADNVLGYQSNAGAWPKNWDLAVPATPGVIEVLNREGKANTIDNDATTLPMVFLALVATATGKDEYAKAFMHGLDYLLAAQYENGGWPQFFPLRDGYYSHITFNDNAMMNVMFLLRDVAGGKEPYAFVDDERAAQAASAVERGIDCILRTQIRLDGKLMGWAAQYDEVTLEAAWARSYEPPSLAGEETVPVVRFLLESEEPTSDQVAAIEGAVAWLKAVTIRGFRYYSGLSSNGEPDSWIVADQTAAPIWARFYEIGTNRPLFLGRDGNFRYSLDQIEQERRGGYAYYGEWANSLLNKDYPRWRASQSSGLGQAKSTANLSLGYQNEVLSLCVSGS